MCVVDTVVTAPLQMGKPELAKGWQAEPQTQGHLLYYCEPSPVTLRLCVHAYMCVYCVCTCVCAHVGVHVCVCLLCIHLCMCVHT